MICLPNICLLIRYNWQFCQLGFLRLSGSPYCCVGSNRDTNFWANHGNSRSHTHLLSTNHHGQFPSFIYIYIYIKREQMICVTWGGGDKNSPVISHTSQPWKRFQERLEAEMNNFGLRACLYCFLKKGT